MPIRYGSIRLGAATLYRRVTSRPDRRRWGDLENFDPAWDPRARIIAQLIPPRSRVIEFGAGRRQLEAMLDDSCEYTPSDLVARGDGTLVVDLNRRPLPTLAPLQPDVAVFAGVLEYLTRLDDIPIWLADQVATCIVSYECATSPPRSLARAVEATRRWRTGWVNTYTESELRASFGAAGYECADARTWSTPQGDERIFVFARA